MSGRPRGFATWSPQPATLALVDTVSEILDNYEAQLPLTARQIFYVLVGQYDYDKTDQAYARLCEHLVRARRSGMISFDSIRDDGTVERQPISYDGWDDYWSKMREHAEYYQRDRLLGQAARIELWCEAAGMVPQLARVAHPYSVPVYSTGGFSSVTVTREIAARALQAGKPTVLLHVGDYDPSGESIFNAIAEDAGAFVLQVRGVARESVKDPDSLEISAAEVFGIETAELRDLAVDGRLQPERVALTRDQVEEYDLPTAPSKRSDKRSRNWHDTETCQAEALRPDVLAEIVARAISDHVDALRFDGVRRDETGERDRILGVFDEDIDYEAPEDE